MSDIQAMARGFLDALHAGALYQPPSAGAALDLEHAYAVQAAFNDLRAAQDPLCGYKAGVNSAAAQRALNLAGPVTGALFASGGRPSGAEISRRAFRDLVVETELGFRTARRIDRPIAAIAELPAAIATVAPMFELADPGFGRAPRTGTDMIATNLACGGFVEGVARPVDEVDINSVELILERDGVQLHAARAADLSGDHWQALLWLVNALVGRGVVIEPGQLLLTGALGPAQPADVGEYVGRFGGLGEVRARIVP